ncbi:TPA: 50S ribosomal protein L6 [Candidatus Galligastranaerophilus intestinavium]|uniref:Large ribosomal subunit protein uL6 n=1 Tax=Candidatus Galligastranaerophilus intestinavium TaxID=2840836 RepID=A0A9D1JXL4_9BACT|nr:50S ribosomal protein L6 [Candidatus Galligastranaerophilus intestinavium]
MSRIGKLPVHIPDGVEVKVENNLVSAKGPMGSESVQIREEIEVKIDGKEIVLTRKNDDRKSRSLHGLSRTLVQNVVTGVKEGFTKKLEIQGVGYRAQMQGTAINLQLGYSHPIVIEPPQGIKIAVEANTKITVTGSNKQMVGDVAAQIRSKRPPEVYKGKGIRYEGEFVRRKAGKAGKK